MSSPLLDRTFLADVVPRKAYHYIYRANYPANASAVDRFHVWQKPKGISWCYFFTIGGGGRGGPGGTGIGASDKGGGGGGSGGQMISLIPAFVLPETLLVYVGNAGYNSGSPNGKATKIQVGQDTSTTADTVCSANGGNGGTASAVGTGGVATNIGYGQLGLAVSLAGQNGFAGGTNGAGTDITYPTTGLRVTGGAGGAGGDHLSGLGSFVGGALPAQGALFPGAPADLNQGFAYGLLSVPMFFYGGTGGSNNGGGPEAGKGGGYGCGGGGGAWGNTVAGGDSPGGDGLAIIICW